jgi:hypothetical protein
MTKRLPLRLPIASLFDDQEPTYPILVVEDKRGVVYDAQVGGMCCNQTEFQGIPFMLWGFDKYYTFELHITLCCPDDESDRQMMAECFDALPPCFELGMKFDYERINEFQEGCIPVLLSGVYDRFGTKYDCNGKKGMIFTGNCD